MTKYLPHVSLSLASIMTIVLATASKVQTLLPPFEAWAVGVGIPAFVGVVSWISQEAQNWKGLGNLNLNDFQTLIQRITTLETAVKQIPGIK